MMNGIIHYGAPGWWNAEALGISLMSGFTLQTKESR